MHHRRRVDNAVFSTPPRTRSADSPNTTPQRAPIQVGILARDTLTLTLTRPLTPDLPSPPAAGVERILASVRSRHLQHKEAKKERGFRYDKEAGALLDRLRRMAKPQPVEELAAEPGDGRVVKKLSARAIREKAEAEAERRRVALANELSAQSAQVHDIALRMVDIEDANEEGSW